MCATRENAPAHEAEVRTPAALTSSPASLPIGACLVDHTMTSPHLHNDGLKLKPTTICGVTLWGDSESISLKIHRFSIKN